MPKTLQLRRDAAADWASNNPTLSEGEIGYETDTGKIKIGDGGTTWNSLDYLESAIDHDQLTNFASNEHFVQTAITNVSSALATGLLKVTNGTGELSVVTDNSSNWDTAYGWGDHSGQGYLTGITGESIGDLSDVDLTDIADTKILKYNSGAGKWECKDETGGGVTDHDALNNLAFADAGHTGFQAQGDVLDDLNTLGANSDDSEFLVGTGAGALAWESGATARTSIGLGSVENTALSTWAGTTNITTLGTIATVGNITIANGGIIRCAGAPVLTFNDTLDKLSITGGLEVGLTLSGAVGVLTLGKLQDSTRFYADTYSASNSADRPFFAFRRSHQNTVGVTATVNGDYLGSIVVYGVNTVPQWGAISGQINVIQHGAAGAVYVPADMIFSTSSNSAYNVNQLILHNSGGIFMSTLKSGANQAGAGAAANELWIDTADRTIKVGV